MVGTPGHDDAKYIMQYITSGTLFSGGKGDMEGSVGHIWVTEVVRIARF
jgi:hypothetical protein